MTKANKTPVKVLKLVAALNGRKLVVTNHDISRVGCEPEYTIEPGGRVVTGDAFRRALAIGLLRPIGDGLFPEVTQTYELQNDKAL